MTDIQVRSTVCAVVIEDTEGTLKAPTAATNYIKLQSGFSMVPQIENVENLELSGTLGRSKGILGGEDPVFTASHYLRGSGTAATAPNYGNLIYSSLGATDTESTEYDTVSGSSVSGVVVDSGEGASYRKGQALLVKHSAFAWELMPVESISTDTLTPAFDLANAPTTGINLGRATTYYPAETGHPTLSIWNYLGETGGRQALAGGRTTSWSVEATAGQLININYTVEGIWFGFNPIYIDTDDIYIDWTDDDGTFAAAVASGWYKSPQELASAIQTAMNATATTETHTVSYSSTTGKYTFTATGTTLSLLWNSGSNTANTIGDQIGFTVASDDSGTAAGTGYTSDTAASYDPPQTPSYDSADAITAKNMLVLIGDRTDNTCFEVSSFTCSVNTPKAIKGDICAEGGRGGSNIIDREIVISFTAYLQKFETDKFNRFSTNQDTRFAFLFGEKSGGNWVETKAGTLYAPNTTIKNWRLEEVDGLFVMNAELHAFDDGNGDIFLSTI